MSAASTTLSPRDTAAPTNRDMGQGQGANMGPPRPTQGTTVGTNAQTTDMRSARPFVGNGQGEVPYNTRMVHPYEPTADSATIDVYTGMYYAPVM